jgi:hypothetical protein
MSKDHNPTMSELIEFISALTGDVCSLIKADYATLAATVTGAPERLSDVAERFQQGRGYLRSLDKLFEAADDVICAAAERA